MQRLLGKVAVVTGGNSGIGKGIAKLFFEQGAKVVIFGRNETTLAEARADISEELLAVTGDITNNADRARLFSETEKAFGKIDILVANAGVGSRINIDEATEEKFDYMVNINYRGLFFTVKDSLAHMNDNASMILVASIAGHLTIGSHSIYSSTKAAVVKLAQNLSNDLAPRHIRVNSISPGFIRTPIFDDVLQDEPDYLTARGRVIPLQRIGEPEDIANAAVFLASSESSYITGTDLIVDGGYTASFPSQ